MTERGATRAAGRLARAIGLGGGAAALAAVGVGLTAHVAGWMVVPVVALGSAWLIGWAVRRGSRRQGGWAYGLLAVTLTYAALVVGAAPEVAQAAAAPEPAAGLPPGAGAPAVSPVALALLYPILATNRSIGLLALVVFALLQAWRLGARAPGGGHA